MPFEFVVQPFDDGYHLRDFFSRVADDRRYTSLDIVVAWVKRTGLDEIASSINAIRDRGGTVRVISGISLGGTSRQGLELLLRLADMSYVFHQPGRTFHPKVYSAKGDQNALIVVGSHNVTLGGVTRNFEAGILGDLDLTDRNDRDLLQSIDHFIERLIADVEVCRPLTEEFLDELVRDRRLPLADEDRSGGTMEPVEGVEPTPADADRSAIGPPLFGSSRERMRRSPARPARARPEVTPPITPVRPPRRGPAARPLRRWFKRLPPADAQRLVGSNVSNTMTLVKQVDDFPEPGRKTRHPIDVSTYFRDEFFGNEVWYEEETRGRRQEREVATIECEVVVRDESLGAWMFEIRHTPGYEAEERNRTTEFAWGSLPPTCESMTSRGTSPPSRSSPEVTVWS